MADLQALHTQAKKLILTIRAGLERLETAEQVGGAWHERAAGLCSCLLPRLPAAGVDIAALCLTYLQNTRAIVPSGLAAELQQQLHQLQVGCGTQLCLAASVGCVLLVSLGCTFSAASGPAAARPPRLPCPAILPLQRLSGELDAVWRMQSMREPAAKRDIWKRKVEQVRPAG